MLDLYLIDHIFQDNDFASQKPLKLNLVLIDKSSPHLIKPKVGHIFSIDFN